MLTEILEIILPLLCLSTAIAFMLPKKSKSPLNPSISKETIGTIQDISQYVETLLKSQQPDAFLIIEIEGKDDFLQFSSDGSVLQMDFPQITERQKSLRPRIEQVCMELNLPLEISHSSNGDVFLEYVLSGDSHAIADSIVGVMKQLFLIDETTRLGFEGENT